MAQGDIDFQNLPCSGAVVDDILEGGNKSQIDAWTNPSNADIATLTIGGNDVGFYSILTACVLRVGQAFSGDCVAAVDEAVSKVNGPNLFNDISLALHQIIHKSGREDFRVYLTGYPTFFENRTASCDYTTFFYWHPGHHPIHLPGNWAYLFQELRLQLNNLIRSLNRELSQVADSVNSAYQEQHVWFVDPNPFFDGHRFCGVAPTSETIGGFEVNTSTEVIEPDSSHLDTWLFLSGWPDNSLPGTEPAQHAKEEDLETVIAGNITALPDPTTCNSTLGQSTDWADRMLCDTAMAVAGSEPSGYYGPSDAAAIVDADIQAFQDQNYSAIAMPWWTLTRQAKTFHPRTLGQQAYKLAIMDVWTVNLRQVESGELEDGCRHKVTKD